MYCTHTSIVAICCCVRTPLLSSAVNSPWSMSILFSSTSWTPANAASNVSCIAGWDAKTQHCKPTIRSPVILKTNMRWNWCRSTWLQWRLSLTLTSSRCLQCALWQHCSAHVAASIRSRRLALMSADVPVRSSGWLCWSLNLFQICGFQTPLLIDHVIRRMRSAEKALNNKGRSRVNCP